MYTRLLVTIAVAGGCRGAARWAEPMAENQVPPPDEHAHGGDEGSLGLDDIAAGATVLPDLGTHTRTITTSSAEAQTYFDQGLRLLFAFNHDEAARSFARAAELDPACASCWWGVALVLGPNYNMPMLENRFPS